MNRLLFARWPVLLTRLPVRLGSLLGRVSVSFFDPRLCPAPTHLHVQLSYLWLTSAWASFFRRIPLVLISKSPDTLLRSA